NFDASAAVLPAPLWSRPLPFQYERVLLHQDRGQFNLEHFVLWELGQSAPREFSGGRLRHKYRAVLDLRFEMTAHIRAWYRKRFFSLMNLGLESARLENSKLTPLFRLFDGREMNV